MTPLFCSVPHACYSSLMNTTTTTAPAALAPAVAALEAAGFRAIEADALGVSVDLTRADKVMREYATRVATEAGAVLVDMGVGGLFLIEPVEAEVPAEIEPAARVIEAGSGNGRGTVVEVKRSLGADYAAVQWDAAPVGAVDWRPAYNLLRTGTAPRNELTPAPAPVRGGRPVDGYVQGLPLVLLSLTELHREIARATGVDPARCALLQRERLFRMRGIARRWAR